MKIKHNNYSKQCIQNSGQTTSNAHCSLQPFAGVITERIENIQINELNYHFSEETLEECHYESTKNKAEWPLSSLQRENQNKKGKQK